MQDVVPAEPAARVVVEETVVEEAKVEEIVAEVKEGMKDTVAVAPEDLLVLHAALVEEHQQAGEAVEADVVKAMVAAVMQVEAAELPADQVLVRMHQPAEHLHREEKQAAEVQRVLRKDVQLPVTAAKRTRLQRKKAVVRIK